MLEAMPARHGLLPASRLRGTEETSQPALSKPPRPEPHWSGQPGGFHVRAGLHEDDPSAEVRAVAPPRRRRRRADGRTYPTENQCVPCPAAKPRGRARIIPFQRPAIRRGHPPAGGAPNAGSQAPKNYPPGLIIFVSRIRLIRL